jgi:hypothetical protein
VRTLNNWLINYIVVHTCSVVIMNVNVRVYTEY